MQPYPHHYRAKATGLVNGDLDTTSERLTPLHVASPAEFDGPGDRWSPETMLVAAVADCLILTFRSVARAAKIEWTTLDCDVIGTLDRVNGAAQFTRYDVTAHLVVADAASVPAARAALDKAERYCLISNSLKGTVHLTANVEAAERLRDVLVAR